MKKLLFTLSIILAVTLTAFSQSTEITPGSVLPQMTTVQRTGLANPINGMLVYDTNTNSYWFYQQNTWAELPKAGSTYNYWELNGLNGNEIKNTNSGGFWTANPTTIQNGGDLVNTVPVEVNGTRLVWIPSMSAFRVGTVAYDSKAWDKDMGHGVLGWASIQRLKVIIPRQWVLVPLLRVLIPRRWVVIPLLRAILPRRWVF